MTDELKSPKEALDEASFLMQKAPKRFTIEYIYHWNRLLIYLYKQIPEEESK